MKMKQTNIGSWWGGFMVLIARVTGYATFMILGMNTITTYPLIAGWMYSIIGINVPVFVFILIIGFVLVVGMIIEYKYSLGSIQSFSNEQWYKHDNPMKKYMEEHDRIYNEKLDRIIAILPLADKNKVGDNYES
jgi:hypothetical protein